MHFSYKHLAYFIVKGLILKSDIKTIDDVRSALNVPEDPVYLELWP